MTTHRSDWELAEDDLTRIAQYLDDDLQSLTVIVHEKGNETYMTAGHDRDEIRSILYKSRIVAWSDEDWASWREIVLEEVGVKDECLIPQSDQTIKAFVELTNKRYRYRDTVETWNAMDLRNHILREVNQNYLWVAPHTNSEPLAREWAKAFNQAVQRALYPDPANVAAQAMQVAAGPMLEAIILSAVDKLRSMVLMNHPDLQEYLATRSLTHMLWQHMTMSLARNHDMNPADLATEAESLGQIAQIRRR